MSSTTTAASPHHHQQQLPDKLADVDPDELLNEWLGELENLIGVSITDIFLKIENTSVS